MWDAVRKFLRQDEAPEERPAPGEPAPGPRDEAAPPTAEGPGDEAAHLQREAAPAERPAPESETIAVSPPGHAPQGLAAEETATPPAPPEAAAWPAVASSALPETAPSAAPPEPAATGGSTGGAATEPPASELAADVATASAAAPTAAAGAAPATETAEVDAVSAPEAAAPPTPAPTEAAAVTSEAEAAAVVPEGETTDSAAPVEEPAATTPEGMAALPATPESVAPAADVAAPSAEAAPAATPAEAAPAAETTETTPAQAVSDNVVAAEPAPEAAIETPGAEPTAPRAEADRDVAADEAAATEDTTEAAEAPAETEAAALTPLAAGTMVGGRYKIAGLAEGAELGDETLTYRAVDTRSYERCWSCGSAENAQATRFCQRCGAPIQDHPVTLIETREASGEPGEVAHDGAYFHVEPERRRFGAEGIGIEIGAHSAEGPHHPNEDSYWYVTRTLCANSGRQSLAVAAFADGMGGYAPGSGLISARIAATAGSHILAAVESRDAAQALDEGEAAGIMRAAIAAANGMVLDEISRTGEMGATLVLALIYGETAYLTNIGDSRAYYVDPRGRATAITRDQSLVAQEVAQGHLAESDVYTAIGNNIILHAVGEEGVEDAADWYTQPLEPGSYLLLCSDGYWKTLHGEVMPEGTLDGSATLSEAARRMVDNALTQGSDDNTTVVLIAIS